MNEKNSKEEPCTMKHKAIIGRKDFMGKQKKLELLRFYIILYYEVIYETFIYKKSFLFRSITSI